MYKFNRTSADGSFIFYDNNFDFTKVNQLPKLSKSLMTTMQALFDVYSLIDEERTVSTSAIGQTLNLSPATLNSRLRKLKQLNFLVEKPFSFTETNLVGRTQCLVISLTENAINEIKNSDNEKQSKSKQIAKRRENEKRAFSELGFRSLPSTQNIETKRQMSFFPCEQLTSDSKLPLRHMVKNFRVRTADGGSKEIPAKVQSFSRIMNTDDLQVLFAVYSLIHKYHESDIIRCQQESRLPVNVTPVHIDDIIRVRRKTEGGRLRAKYRESLQAIKDTKFDLYGLASFEFNDQSIKGYISREFRNFKQCTGLSEAAPVIVDGDIEFGHDSMIYLIELPDHVFESLIFGENHFVFPPSSLAVGGLVFMLYLRFRSLSKDNCFDEYLRATHIAISPGSEFFDFKKSLKNQMLKVSKLKTGCPSENYLTAIFDDELNELYFNLWGYHGKISFKENFITVKCHTAEMIAACGLNPETQQAPTSINYINRILEPVLQIEKSLPKNLSKVITAKFGKYSVSYHINGTNMQLSAYSSEQELAQLINILAKHYNMEPHLIRSKVTDDIQHLSRIFIADREISFNEYNHIVDYFGHNDTLSVEVVNFIVKNRSIHSEIISLLDTQEASSNLINKFENYSWKRAL